MNDFLVNPVFRAICKFIYKYSHPKSYRHNRRYWPYYKLDRDEIGAINKLFFMGTLIADNTVLNKPTNNKAMLVATGPSIKEIDPQVFQRTDIDYIGVNGAAALDISFKYYVLIDENFIKNRFDLVKKVLSNAECTLFITPRCIDLVLRKIKFKNIKCSIKIIETVTEDKIKPFLAEAVFANRELNHYYFKGNSGFSTNIFHSIYDYFTVAYVAIQIIYALGYKTIHIAGLDMNNFETPRFYESKENKQPTMLNRYAEGIFLAFDAAAEFFENNNVQVYNLSKTSAIKSFKKVNPEKLILNNELEEV